MNRTHPRSERLASAKLALLLERPGGLDAEPESKRDILIAPPLFILAVCFLLIADLPQFQRIETGYLKIAVALRTR